MNRWLRRTRVRLALAYSGMFTVILLAGAAALWLTIAAVEYSAIDESLHSESNALESVVSAGNGLALRGSTNPAPTVGGVVSYLFDSQARLLDSVGHGVPGGSLAPVARRAAASGQVLETATVNGVAERVRATRFTLPGGDNRVLVVTRSMAEANQLLSTTASVLVLGVAVLIVAATVLGYGFAGTALRPVREIVAEARKFNEDDLHRRINMNLPADELGELAETFNGMAARLETAFQSLRRFTADAAHELRAPLTLIRTEAEVSLGRPREPAEYQATLGTILAEAKRMGRLADQLLMLARVEAGALLPRMDTLDLAGLVQETARAWSALAAERNLAIRVKTRGEACIEGDPDLLRRLLDNLVDNAIGYAPPGSEITLSTRLVDRRWEVVVADQGPGVPGAARAAIFDRFARADEARTRGSGGAGLGLALSAAIARVHRGSLTLDDGPLPGARFVVRLPAASS
ncbi:MAG: ATP-binding protein [Candidatus Dormibacteria bacterium]